MRRGLVARLVAAGLSATLLWLVVSRVGGFLLTVEAASISSVLGLLGVEHLRVANTIYIWRNGEPLGFRIEWHCSGFLTYTMFLVLVLFLANGLREKLFWLLLGFLVIFAVNILRILLVIAATLWAGLEEAALIHSIVAPLLLLTTLIILGFEVVMSALSHAQRQ
jgi:archaeosortase family protein ArtF